MMSPRISLVRLLAATLLGTVWYQFLTPPLTLGDEAPDPNPVTPVDSVDLSRYTGLWYEVARIPNRFQKQCERGTTAEYALREDGRLDVMNRCLKADGSWNEAKGLARIEDPATNAKLKVSFFSILGWRPVWGDYWVIGLDEDYRWAIVGTPDRKYGWVLARSPELTDDVLEKIFIILEHNGYRATDFESSPQ